MVRGRPSAERTAILALSVATGVAILSAWLVSQVSPAWTTRYFAVVLGPLLVLVRPRHRSCGPARALPSLVIDRLPLGRLPLQDNKENAHEIAAALASVLQPGELVISTHPEQVPVLRYYLGSGLRCATTLGPVADQQVFDWRRCRLAAPRHAGRGRRSTG